jgi:hypothetical protein
MSTDQSTITPNDLSSPIPFPGVGESRHDAYPQRIASSQSGSFAKSYDPRWIFAMRVRFSLESDPNSDHGDLVEQGVRLGLSPMQSRVVIGIVERAQTRGGFDSIVHQELERVPENTHDGIAALTTKSRWIVFGALFVWAFAIAGLMQLVA